MAHQDSRKIPKLSKTFYCFSQANIGRIVSKVGFPQRPQALLCFYQCVSWKMSFWIFDFYHDFSCFFQKNKEIPTFQPKSEDMVSFFEKKHEKSWKNQKPKLRFLKKSIASNKVEPVSVAHTQPWHYPTIIGLSNAIANNVQYGDFLDFVMFHGWFHDAFVANLAHQISSLI